MKPMTSTPSPSGRAFRSVLARAVPIVAILAVAIGGWFTWTHFRDRKAPVTYTTSAVERGSVRQTVTSSGTLSPVVRSTVGSQVSGRLTEVLVDYNDRVVKGQVLARLDKQLLAGQVAQARARLTSARTELARAQVTSANAKLTFDRSKSLIESGAIATSEVDAAKAASEIAVSSVAAARASIVEAQASLQSAETNLAYTTITAPIDGVIISRSVDAGQTVAASLQAPELFVIAGDLAKMELHAAVAEADVGQLVDGLKVELAFDAFPDRTFVGSVRQVRNQATTTSNVVTYDAVVSVDNPDGALRPGMTATATFVVAASPATALMVPQKALRYRPANAPAPERPTRPGGRGERGAKPAAAGGAPEAIATAGKPDATAVKPDATQPDATATKSDATAVKPDATAVKPDATAAKPDATAAKPDAAKPDAKSDAPRERTRGAVWVLRAGVPVRVGVAMGLSDGTSVSVTSEELQEGDLVITGDSTAKTPAAGGAPGAAGQRGRSGAAGGRRGPPSIL